MKSIKHTESNISKSKTVCICGTQYKHNQSLCRHKKTCKEYLQLANPEKKQLPQCSDDSEMSDPLQPKMISKQKYMDLVTHIAETMKQNSDLINVVAQQQEKLNDIIPMIGNTTNVTNVDNSVTNNMNINVFLNEKCKDAVNLMDFVNSIQLQMSDLERTTEVGFVESISSLLIDGLNQMNVTDRPIHCTDGKRDVLYVKDNDAWEKEKSGHPNIKRAISSINKRNSRQLPKWMDDNPECNDPESHKSAKYMNILSSIVPDDEEKKVKRIIKNVAKSVVLDKDTCMNDE